MITTEALRTLATRLQTTELNVRREYFSTSSCPVSTSNR